MQFFMCQITIATKYQAHCYYTIFIKYVSICVPGSIKIITYYSKIYIANKT